MFLVQRPLFPENEDLRFVAGQPSELCLGFVNSLDRFINFTHVDASLRSLHDEREVIQNMTRQFYGINTPGKATSVAIDYQFKPDAMLDATTYVLVVEVSYRDGETNHTEVVFNRTVVITEPDQKLINTETLFLALVVAASTAAVVYFGGAAMKKKLGGGSGAKSRSYSPAAKGVVRESFLEGTTAAGKTKSPKKK